MILRKGPESCDFGPFCSGEQRKRDELAEQAEGAPFCSRGYDGCVTADRYSSSMRILSTRHRQAPQGFRTIPLAAKSADSEWAEGVSEDRVSLASSSREGWANALDLLKGITEKKGEADLQQLAQTLVSTQKADGGWSEGPLAEGSDPNTSLIHHVAVATYLRRVEHAEEYRKNYTQTEHQQYTPPLETLQALEQSLKKSWANLNGSVGSQKRALLGPLPKVVVERVAAAPASIHEALLGDSLEVRLHPGEALRHALSRLEDGVRGEPLQSQISPKSKVGLFAGVAAVGVGALTAISSTVGLAAAAAVAAPILAGVAVGWMAASYNESLVHDKVLHVQDLPGAGKKLSEDEPKSLVTRVYSKSPEWVKKSVFDAWFDHTKIHHYRTFSKDHSTQFRNPEEQTKLDGYLLKKGHERLIDEEYGLTIGWGRYLRFQAVALPVYSVAVGAAGALGVGALGMAATAAAAPLFAAGFAAPALAYPLFSKDYHRFTHMEGKKALKTASWPMRKFVQTPASRHIVRRHFVHHENELVNFNLMPGADWLRGKAQAPTVAQEEEMRRLKLLW